MKHNGFHVPVSLIIITYNKLSRLVLTLESIKKADYIEKTEVIIVNDGSDDGTREYLDTFKEENRDLEIKVIHIVNSGRSVARNAGILQSTGSLLIFMDDDLLISKEFITAHWKAHEGREDLIVHGRIFSFPVLKFMKDPTTGVLYSGQTAKSNLSKKVLTPDMIKDSMLFKEYVSENARLSKFENDINELFHSTQREDSYIRWIGTTGGNLSVQRKKIVKLENFDPYMGKIWGCEDLELGYRAYLSGCQFVYSPEAVNYHINHYREDFIEIHNISLDYFISKHKDRSINTLKEYFHANLTSLMDWKAAVDKAG